MAILLKLSDVLYIACTPVGSCPIVFKVCTGSKDVTITAPANDVEFFEHLDCLDVREEYVAGDLKVTFIDYMLLTNIFCILQEVNT